MPEMLEEAVYFDSHGTRCAGRIYVNENQQSPLPCIVMVNGFTGTMDWLLPDYAQRFAAAGYLVLTFDYRFFGQSEGTPRQLIDIHKQREDIIAAVDFIRQDRRVDRLRIVLWGTSLGGGHVFYTAARIPNLAAVIAQVPAFDMVSKDARALVRLSVGFKLKLLLAAMVDSVKGLLGLSPYYMKVYGERGELAVFQGEDLRENFRNLQRKSRFWKNRFTPRFYLDPPRYRPDEAPGADTPVLVCIARNEIYANPAFQEKIARSIPLGACRIYEADHFDFYHKMLSDTVEDQVAFLDKWV
ncbi:alpha/beta hydrolase [Dyadobacter aurulentus]|uniref:alpha/beta hydrolase n=1 Tax=Dyadobacter sp. UC 10 TaxID=2605428 RepID=UPI001788A29D|nr:alpha/beta fold hydrolase [Dyadobacter sp. UC 10]